ncbi:MAG: hypothetical protein R3266_06460 [Gemmatimonadota bacterium]|nr:hypothetical protein [Gemmatimonadota bacterium]
MVGLALLALPAIIVACGDNPLAPQDELARVAESVNFVYYAAPGDGVDPDFQERHYTWAMERLGLSYPAPIEYRKYRDREHLERVTGHQTNGFAEPGRGRFHTIGPIDNHEYIHVVFVTLVGDSPALFNEGVAVAHHGASIHGEFDGDPTWSGTPVHDIARNHGAAGTLPGLTELAVSHRFREYDPEITYPVAGSFVRFLIDESGIDAFKDYVGRTGPNDDYGAIAADFQAVYGETLEGSWERWLSFLEGRGETP